MTCSMCNVSHIWWSISNTLSCPHVSLWSSLTVLGRIIKHLWILCSLSYSWSLSFHLYYLYSILNPIGLFSPSPPASGPMWTELINEQQKYRRNKVPSLKTAFLSASVYMENLLFAKKKRCF